MTMVAEMARARMSYEMMWNENLRSGWVLDCGVLDNWIGTGWTTVY